VLFEQAVLQFCAHPNIIECHGSSEDGSVLVLEKGSCDLFARITSTEEEAMEVQEVLDIALGVSSAMAFMHGKNYVHNDVKLENVVMVQRAEGLVPKLIDFEFANRVEADGQPPHGEEKMAGTRAYFSPERFYEDEEELCGDEHYDRRAADVWALGVTLHLAAFRQYPNGTSQSMPLLQGDYIAPEGTDAALAHILEHMLKACPTERWTVAEVSEFLEQRALSYAAHTRASSLEQTSSESSTVVEEIHDWTELEHGITEIWPGDLWAHISAVEGDPADL